MKRPAVYILASRRNGTLYTGVSSNLVNRVFEHKDHAVPGFTRRHGVDLLVWFEVHPKMESAIRREKAIKQWRRSWKLQLIEETNPCWRDLFGSIVDVERCGQERTPHRSQLTSDVAGENGVPLADRETKNHHDQPRNRDHEPNCKSDYEPAASTSMLIVYPFRG